MQDVTMTDPTFSSTDVGSFIHLAPVQHQPVFEAIKRAVMQFAYADLECDPTAAPRSPHPQLATSEDDLYRSIVSLAPTTVKVVLGGAMINGMSFNPTDRGRAVWANNSYAIDCDCRRRVHSIRPQRTRLEHPFVPHRKRLHRRYRRKLRRALPRWKYRPPRLSLARTR